MRTPSLSRLALALLLCLIPATLCAAKESKTERAVTEITALLNDFLAHNDQRAVHDRFWASDLVYTSSMGEVKRKPDIMKSFDEEPAATEKASPPTWSAEDILVRPYGEMAALTFKLVQHKPDGTLGHFRDSGTLLRRDGKWQVVTWQATKIPDAVQ